VQIGPIDVEPGVERTQCVIKRLSNAAQIRVGRIDNAITNASHHLIVYRTNDSTEQLTPFDCDPFKDTLDPAKGAPIMVTQKHDDSLVLPTGVAYTLDAGQMIRLELHYINTGAAKTSVTATSTFTSIPDASFQHEAGFLFIGTPDIDIPANSKKTIGPMFFQLPADLAGSSVFAITGHTHQYGTNMRVWTAPGDQGPDTPVYDVPGWSWSEPATIAHEPAFQLPTGGGFRFECDYQNTSSASVSFGESATQEMCFFWAYYYPNKGSKVCVHTTQLGGVPLDACCPGNAACGFLGL